MNKEHYIDNLLKNKLQHFEKSPGLGVWDKLDAMLLEKERSKKRMAIFWYSLAASFIGFLLIFSFLTLYQQPAQLKGLAENGKQILKKIKKSVNGEDSMGQGIKESQELKTDNKQKRLIKDQDQEYENALKENLEQEDKLPNEFKEEANENLITQNEQKNEVQNPTQQGSKGIKVKVTIKTSVAQKEESLVAENKKEPRSKTGKFFQQLNNLRTGEPVDLEAMGFKKSDKKEIRK